MPPRFQAVICDMDGLLLDTEPGYRWAWGRASADLGFELGEGFWRSLAGCQCREIEHALIAACGAGLPLPRFRELSAAHWSAHVAAHGISPKPGADRLIEWLQRRAIPFCLATNSGARNARRCLALARMEHRFFDIVTRDQVPCGKPAPDIFHEAARRMGVRPECCLALEDSIPGIVAAAAAGTMPILIPDAGAPRAEATARALAVFANLDGLLAWLDAHGEIR